MADDEEASTIESFKSIENHEISGKKDLTEINMVLCVEQEINIQNHSVVENNVVADPNEKNIQLTIESPTDDILKSEDINKNQSVCTNDLENNNDIKKQKQKPVSPSLHKKEESPHIFRKSLTAEELKSKKRLTDSKSKEDERRAAVLKRKKKLEDEENARKEAIYKKLSANAAPVDTTAIRKRYSLSTSNLLQLRKNKPLEKEIDIGDKKPAEKQKIMQRPRSSASTSNLLKSKDKITHSKADSKQSTTPKENPAKSPTTRHSLNQRPSTALGISTSDKKRTPQSTPLNEKKVKKVLDVERPLTAPKTLKSKSESSPPKKPDSAVRSKSDSCTPKHSSTPKKVSSPTLKIKKENKDSNEECVLEHSVVNSVPDPKKNVAKISKSGKNSSVSGSKAPKISEKSIATGDTNHAKSSLEQAGSKGKSKTNVNKKAAKTDLDAKSKAKTEEEAKKALAEHRKKAKEEAEAKAKADKEKDEEECRRREEEERKLAKQLEEEEALQSALLDELQHEEEERRQKMIEEKEKRDRDEKQKSEEEQRLRDEEIERKAKLELEKHLKEQEIKEQELDAERIERKKRVEMIMARVSAKRSDQPTDSPGSTQNIIPSEENNSPTEVDSENTPTRLKVDRVLQRLNLSSDNLLNTSKNAFNFSESDSSKQPPDEEQSLIGNVTDKLEAASTNTVEHGKSKLVTDCDSLSIFQEPVKIDAVHEVESFKTVHHVLLNNAKTDVSNNGNNENPLNIIVDSVISNEEKERPFDIVMSSNNNTVVIQNGDAHKDISEHWSDIENHMKEMQIDSITSNVEEKKLWKVVEGSVDISECF